MNGRLIQAAALAGIIAMTGCGEKKSKLSSAYAVMSERSTICGAHLTARMVDFRGGRLGSVPVELGLGSSRIRCRGCITAD